MSDTERMELCIGNIRQNLSFLEDHVSEIDECEAAALENIGVRVAYLCRAFYYGSIAESAAEKSGDWQ